jgi:hypothetical protein
MVESIPVDTWVEGCKQDHRHRWDRLVSTSISIEDGRTKLLRVGLKSFKLLQANIHKLSYGF